MRTLQFKELIVDNAIGYICALLFAWTAIENLWPKKAAKGSIELMNKLQHKQFLNKYSAYRMNMYVEYID